MRARVNRIVNTIVYLSAATYVFFICNCILLKTASLFFKLKKYNYARFLYRLETRFLPFWSLPRERLKNTEEAIKAAEKRKFIEENAVIIDPSLVQVINKRVLRVRIKDIGSEGYLLSALFKNNAEVGIPSVKVRKITMYYKGEKVEERSGNLREFFLVSKGEYPFHFLMIIRKFPLQVDDFEIDFKIDPFIPNKNVVRLSMVDVERVSIKRHINGWTYYRYKVRLANETEDRIDKIFRVTFLEYKGFPLTRIDCCGYVSVEESIGDKNFTGLEKTRETELLSLNSGEKATIEISLKVEDLFSGYFKPDEVELVGYFIGTKVK